MEYNFKFWEELVWGAIVAAVVFVLTAFVASDGVDDWTTWLIAIGSGAARAAAAVVLTKLLPLQKLFGGGGS